MQRVERCIFFFNKNITTAMKITVLNGSPKGESSITLFTVKYLGKHFPEDTFTIWHVGQKVKYYEKNSALLHELSEADLILFAYPIYTTLAPAQLHRIIALLKEEKVDLSNKWMAQITTSKKFFDFTALRYIEDNCFDLNMKMLPPLSTDMMDLTLEKGRELILNYWRKIHHNIDNNIALPSYLYAKARKALPIMPEAPTMPATEKKNTYTVTILTDYTDAQSNLARMIDYFTQLFPYMVKVANIANFPFSAGCLGCLRCTETSVCVLKDKFDQYLRDDVYQTDALIMAFDIKDHSFGPTFKMYDDRNFCFGHRSPIMGKPLGYIVAGNLSEEDNLLTLLNSRGEIGHNPVAYTASDEFAPYESLRCLADQLAYLLENPSPISQNFYGVGGHKIFRDLVYEMRGIMQSDHQFYKKHHLYDDFPSKKWKNSLLMILVGKLMKNPKFRSKFDEGITAPFVKALKKY